MGDKLQSGMRCAAQELSAGMLSNSCCDAVMPSHGPCQAAGQGQAGYFLCDADSCASWVMGSWPNDDRGDT